MKRITLALSLLGLVSVAYAGHPGDTVVAPVGVNLVAPESPAIWTFGFEGGYARASGNDFTYGQLLPVGASGTVKYNDQTVSNHSEWGGTADVDYKFANSSRDIKFVYTKYDLDDAKTTNVQPGQQLTAPITLGGGILPTNLQAGSNAKGSVDNDLDQVDVLFGQSFTIGDRVGLHPFAGLRWVDINQTDKARYNNIIGTNYVQNQLKLTSDFQGIGPRAGIDTSVFVGSGISFVGTVGASLLVGNLDSDIKNAFYGVLVSQNSFSEYKNDENLHVVPEVDARVGINYTFVYSQQTTLNLQVGYQAVDYFNTSDFDYVDATTPNTVNQSNDFGYYGPYLRGALSFA